MDFVCPYKCSYRTNSGYCGSTGGWGRCQYRQYMQLYQPNTVVGYVPPLKKTNADRIRGKDDDGLADFFNNEAFLAPWCDMSCGDVEEIPCRQCILKWLKQEAGR